MFLFYVDGCSSGHIKTVLWKVKVADSDSAELWTQAFADRLSSRVGSLQKCLRFEMISKERLNGLKSSIGRFLATEDGPTAVEYAVMLALIVVVCLAAVSSVGSRANAKFNKVAASLT